MKNFNNVMVDIETLGHNSFSSIVSIGALQFCIETGECGQSFYNTISPASCLRYGLHETEETIRWWEATNRAELLKIRSRGESLPYVLTELQYWFLNLEYPELTLVWGNSNRFDLGLIDNALTVTGISPFWKFHNERDVRTLVSFAPEIKKAETRLGMAHNALDDCAFQVSYCSKIYRKLMGL